MRISYTHNFIFIHVPKTAGTSVVAALAPFTHDPTGHWMNVVLDKIGIRVNHWAHYRNKRFRPHTTARMAKRQLPQNVYDEMFKFAFVRNPWERLISCYHFILRRVDHKRHRIVRSLGGFEAFLQWASNKRKFYSQAGVICDGQGNLMVDFVGRFESLAEDFQYVSDRLNISVTLPHKNKSSHQDYRSYYNARTRNLVANMCRQDIDLFEYTFDGRAGNAASAA